MNVIGILIGFRWGFDFFRHAENGFIDSGCQVIDMAEDVALILPHLVECQQRFILGKAD